MAHLRGEQEDASAEVEVARECSLGEAHVSVRSGHRGGGGRVGREPAFRTFYLVKRLATTQESESKY